jgi:hypothetical protein
MEICSVHWIILVVRGVREDRKEDAYARRYTRAVRGSSDSSTPWATGCPIRNGAEEDR